MKLKRILDSVAVSPRELVSKKFWDTFELAPLDRLLLRHDRLTCLIRFCITVVSCIAAYFVIEDYSKAGILREGIAFYFVVGFFVIQLSVQLIYERQKIIQRKVYT